MSNSRVSNAGVTLLEVLLALAVMGMIGLTMNSLFRTGGQVWQRIDANSSVPDQAIARFDLRRTLENMPIVSVTTSLDAIFRVEADGFAFKGLLPDGDHEGVWSYVQITEDALQISFDNTSQVNSLRSDLVNGKIIFYGRKSVRENADWHDNWNDAVFLPQLIKIETWGPDDTVNPPLSIQPGKIARQSEISLSSLVPPD